MHPAGNALLLVDATVDYVVSLNISMAVNELLRTHPALFRIVK